MSAAGESAGPILIYGAGAVGQFVGATLALVGQAVTLLARPVLRDALSAHPLILAQEGAATATRAVPIPVVTSIAQLARPPALVVLTIKGYDTADALPDLRRLVGGGAVVLTLQNGVGHEEMLVEALGAAAVRSGAFTISVSTPTPGRVLRHTLKGGFGFAPVAQEDLAPLLARFQPTDLPIVTAPTYRVLKWSKLLLNMLANAQAALLDLPPAAIFADPRLFALERRAFLEARAVMRAADIGLTDLPAYPVRALAAAMTLPAPLARRVLAARLGGGRGAKMPSLWIDLDSGKGKNELPWYNGAVVARAQQLGLAVPVNAAFTRLLTAAIADPAVRAALHGKPERLLAEVR